MFDSGKNSIILFDGVCNLCNAAVQFVLKYDKKKRFLFTSLQSDAGKKILLQFDAEKSILDTLILIEDNKMFDRSTAALKIAKNLSSFWKLFYAFIIIPKGIRDTVYKFIAKNRYAWFGKRDTCLFFIEEHKKRFI